MQCPKEVDSLCQKLKQESPETMFEACTEVCQNNKNGRTPDNRICLSLVLSMHLNTRKMGENGAGILKKPISKGMPKKYPKMSTLCDFTIYLKMVLVRPSRFCE